MKLVPITVLSLVLVLTAPLISQVAYVFDGVGCVEDVYLPSSAEAVTMEDGEVVRLPLSYRVDSRRESRIAVEVPVGCRHLEATDSGPSEPLVGEIIDVSQGGAQLWLPRRVPLFGRLEVFMRIEGLNFQGQAEVVGAEVHPKDGRYRHGLRWLGLNAQAKAALSQVIPQLI